MLRELKTFVAVARHGTFAAAGQQVGLTQSAVSAQMRVLEQGLGVRLFERSGRSAVLNAAGRHALPLAEQMLGLYAQMALPTSAAEWQGELKVGAIATLQTGLLPEALPHQAPDAAFDGKSLLVSHGTYDNVIPLTSAHAIRSHVQRLPLQLSYHEYPSMHEIRPDELQAAMAWLQDLGTQG